MKRIAYTITPYTTVIRLLGVVQNLANGFPARPLAFEVHETESGEYRSIKDAGEYYRNGFTNHPYVEEAIEAGYTLNDWHDLSYADKCEFTEMVELYSEGDDYMAPDLNQNWENFDAFIANHSGWLQQNVKPEHSA